MSEGRANEVGSHRLPPEVYLVTLQRAQGVLMRRHKKKAEKSIGSEGGLLNPIGDTFMIGQFEDKVCIYCSTLASRCGNPASQWDVRATCAVSRASSPVTWLFELAGLLQVLKFLILE